METHPEGTPRTVLKWSENLKHEDYQVNGAVCKRIDETAMIYTGFLADEILAQDSPVPYVWSLHIIKRTGRIHIGICLANKAKENMFMAIGWNGMGHGMYLVRDDGFVLSSTDAAMDDKRIYPYHPISTGHTIKLKYDPKAGTLTISPRDTEEFVMTIPPPPEGEVYRPCVYMSETGEEIELVDKK